MNMKTPAHLLGSASSPTTETSADAVHRAPDQRHQDLAPKPIHLEQQQYQAQQEHPDRYDRQAQQPRSPPINYEASVAAPSLDRRDVQGSPPHQRSVAASAGPGVSATMCSNCRTTTTPLWRRAPNGETICNACGLYIKARNIPRPLGLKRNVIRKPAPQPAHEARDGSCAADGHCNGTGGSARCDGCPAYNQHQVNRQALVCANCRTTTTPLWRRDETGNTICNACGLYYKLHSVHRPVTMKRSVIKRRKRVALAGSPQPTHHHHHHHHHHPLPASSPPGSVNEDGDENSERLPPLVENHSQSENGSGTEDEVSDLALRKRKTSGSFSRPLAKRLANQVPSIEDYVAPKRASLQDSWYPHSLSSSPASDDESRRRSLTPVEPAPFQHTAQVQIHGGHHHHHHRHVPTAPAAYQHGNVSPPYSRALSPPAASSSNISSLLNPATPPASGPSASLPSISLPKLSSITPPTPGTPGYPFPSMTAPLHPTEQVLQAHRQELQREVSNLSILLTRTAAMLSNLDNAMAASGTPPTPAPSSTSAATPGVPPLASLLNADPSSASTTLASYVALAAQHAANAQAAVTVVAAAAASAPPPSPVLPNPQYQLPPPVGRSHWPYPTSRSGADSPPQRIPTPPARGL